MDAPEKTVRIQRGEMEIVVSVGHGRNKLKRPELLLIICPRSSLDRFSYSNRELNRLIIHRRRVSEPSRIVCGKSSFPFFFSL